MKALLRKHEQKIRYLLVGGWNTVFSYATFALLYFLLASSIHYIALLVVNYIIGITNAYICYKFLVFKTRGNYLREYIRFYVVYGFAFFLNIALLPIFIEVFKLHPLISQAFILFFIVIISYTGHKNYSFKTGNQPQGIERHS